MIQKIYRTIIALSIVVCGMSILTPVAANACSGAIDCATQGVNATTAGGSNRTPLATRIKTIVNILLFVLGIIAVIVIVIAGIRYATSGGDSGAISGAKDTILYAIIGLIVAILAYAIVNFVISSFAK